MIFAIATRARSPRHQLPPAQRQQDTGRLLAATARTVSTSRTTDAQPDRRRRRGLLARQVSMLVVDRLKGVEVRATRPKEHIAFLRQLRSSVQKPLVMAPVVVGASDPVGTQAKAAPAGAGTAPKSAAPLRRATPVVEADPRARHSGSDDPDQRPRSGGPASAPVRRISGSVDLSQVSIFHTVFFQVRPPHPPSAADHPSLRR